MLIRKRMSLSLGIIALALFITPVMAEVYTTRLLNPAGQPIGTVNIWETPHGILLQAQAQGLPEGWHGFHLHQTGQCNPPNFDAAGGHFNPTGKAHGFLDPKGYHLGDLPNVYVGRDGLLYVDIFAPGITAAQLSDVDGTALMIHQGMDNYMSDPSGDSGDRVACAVIR